MRREAFKSADARAAGDLVFTRELCGSGPTIEDQTRDALNRLGEILAREGLSLQDAVKVQIHLTDMDEYERVNKVYAQLMRAHRPPRSTVEVGALPLKDSGIQVGIIASRSPRKDIYRVSDVWESPGPLYDGALTGDFLFTREICGQGEDSADQTSDALTSLQKILMARGLDFKDTIKVQLYLTDMADYPAVNFAYEKLMGQARPPRCTVEVNRLPSCGSKIKAGIVATTSHSKEIYRAESVRESPGPLLDGALVGKMLFTRDLCGVGDGLEAQTHNAFDSLEKIIEARGFGLRDTVKLQIYLTDMMDWGAVDDIYRQYFQASNPPLSLVKVKSLPIRGSKIKAGLAAFRS